MNHHKRGHDGLIQESSEEGTLREMIFIFSKKWGDFFYFLCIWLDTSDFTVSEDAGIEPITVVTLSFSVRLSKNLQF